MVIFRAYLDNPRWFLHLKFLDLIIPAKSLSKQDNIYSFLGLVPGILGSMTQTPTGESPARELLESSK